MAILMPPQGKVENSWEQLCGPDLLVAWTILDQFSKISILISSWPFQDLCLEALYADI